MFPRHVFIWNIRSLIIALLTVFLCSANAGANNIAVSNVKLTNKNTTANTRDIQFDISWDNSWYISGAPSLTANWDAAWVFAKYRVYSNGVWTNWAHAALLNTGYTAPSGSQMSFGATGSTYKGVFIYRNAAGTGSVSWSSAVVKWDYGTDGLSDDALVQIKLFAIEMVYVPEGNFYIGDTNGDNAGNFKWQDGTGGAPQITSSLSNAINVVGTSYDDAQLEGAGIRIDGDGGLDTNADGTIDNASFPTGWKAFYVMKYELTQGQYRDFLNMLTRTQQNNRTASQAASQFVMSDNAAVQNRSGLRAPATIPAGAITFGCDLDADGTFDESTDGEWIALNYSSVTDLYAYADWAALRPMTELEFEKAARGGQAAVNDEDAWGDTTVTATTSSLTNGGAANETPNQGNINYSTCSPDGPFRVGAYAGASTTRQASGAGYYGAMDLSGGEFERPVTVGNSTGRAYDGSHGDGALSANGHANQANWPGLSSGEMTLATGTGWRGGSHINTAATAAVAYRSSGAFDYVQRANETGGRVARTAP